MTQPQIITLREAGRRIRPTRPLTPQRVRQLAAERHIRLEPLSDPNDRRIKSGISESVLVDLIHAYWSRLGFATIYALIDSATGQPFYVRQTNRLTERLQDHRSTTFADRPHDATILERVSRDEALAREAEWIKKYRALGYPLVNKPRRRKR